MASEGAGELPDGVRLVRALRGHTGGLGRMAWSPDGRLLASPSVDRMVWLWDVETGACLDALEAGAGLHCAAFDPDGTILACGGTDGWIHLWDVTGRVRELHDAPLRTPSDGADRVSSVAFTEGGILASGGSTSGAIMWNVRSGEVKWITQSTRPRRVTEVAFDPPGAVLATSGFDAAIRLWDTFTGRLVRSLSGHAGQINSVAFHPSAGLLASAGSDRTIRLWDPGAGRIVRTLEGHTNGVGNLAFLHDGRVLASVGGDSTIRLWDTDTGDALAVKGQLAPWTSIAANPRLPLLAVTAGRAIDIWELDVRRLLGRRAARSVAYATAKIVLVGDSGVGKTGLGWRLAHGGFREHASSHGQQFWLLDQLQGARADGARCEAILWDLAGQPDYRLIHALSLDDADLALVLFDPTSDDPLHGVEYWLRHLRAPAILVPARTDRGSPRLTAGEIAAFCAGRGVACVVATSALCGDGVEELVARMRELIRWDERSATVTTGTFKRIKDRVLALKEGAGSPLLTTAELRGCLEPLEPFTDAEMTTAVGHLAHHGYVTLLETSRGEPLILLAPELLNNLGSSIVLEARRHPKGLGALEERDVLGGGCRLPELDGLPDADRAVLIDAAVSRFLAHSVCFSGVRPAQLPQVPRLPRADQPADAAAGRGAAGRGGRRLHGDRLGPERLRLAGRVAGLCRHLHPHWPVAGPRPVRGGRRPGLRLPPRGRAGGGAGPRAVLRGQRRQPGSDAVPWTVRELPGRPRSDRPALRAVVCSRGHQVNRAVVREQQGSDVVFCSRCGERLALPRADAPIQLTREQAADVAAQRRVADLRTCCEQALFLLKARNLPAPECFISYAWGNPDHERWVDRELATDLVKAGIRVVLDRRNNARIGSSVSRFVEQVTRCEYVIVVGTPLYRVKYVNEEPMRGHVVAAEGDLIGRRMTGAEAAKRTVLPVLLEGTPGAAFPELLQGRVYEDFRSSEAYYEALLDLVLSMYELPPEDPLAVELRQLIRAGGGL